MTHTAFLNEFCKKETETIYGGIRKRRSMLLELQKDIDFNLGIYKTFHVLELTTQQKHILVELSPLLVVPLLYCSAIDLIARVKYKDTSARGMNARYFKDSAINFFELSDKEATEIWKLRNSLSHQYSISDYIISRSGSSSVVEWHSDDRVVFFVRAMRGSIIAASNRLYEYLINESDEDKILTKDFLNHYGFSYYLIV